MNEIDDRTGLTMDEKGVMDSLMECYGRFLKLEREHPTELRDFVDAVHRIQDLLAVRIVRRVFPEGWSTHEVKTNYDWKHIRCGYRWNGEKWEYYRD